MRSIAKRPKARFTVFGTLGSVLWGCEIYLCFSGECFHRFTVSKHIAAIIFTFLQMHFIVCNSKITFSKSNRLASFGMMHCVAVNLWTWFTMCLVKAVSSKSSRYLAAKRVVEAIGRANALYWTEQKTA